MRAGFRDRWSHEITKSRKTTESKPALAVPAREQSFRRSLVVAAADRRHVPAHRVGETIVDVEEERHFDRLFDRCLRHASCHHRTDIVRSKALMVERHLLEEPEKMTLNHQSLGPDDVRAVMATGVSKAAIEEAIEVAFLFNVYDRLADAMGWDVPAVSSGYYQGAAKRLLTRGYG